MNRDTENASSGTVDATATWIEGVASNALRFAGVNFSAVEAAAASSLDFSNALTFAVWVQATNSADRGLGSYRAHEYDSGWRVFYSTQKVLFQWATDGVLWSLDRSASFPSNQWVHVAAVFSQTVARIYINGILTNSTSTGTNLTLTSNNPLTLGRVYDGNHYALPGSLDDARVYNRALEAGELALLTQARDYSYDAKGNLTGDRVWGYQYDHENRLTVATNGAVRVDYRYDAFGRQIERRTSGATVSTNRLYYAGWQLIAEYNGSGTLQRKYVYGPGIDEPVRMRFTGGVGTNYYYHADGLGSVTEITTNGGFKVESYTYDVYGTPTIYNAAGSVISTPSTGNRLLFTARDRDPDTTLYNYRYRYYSPSLGRFVQVDPIGINGQDFNLYRYVLNNPQAWSDPLGLWGVWIGPIQIGNGNPWLVFGNPQLGSVNPPPWVTYTQGGLYFIGGNLGYFTSGLLSPNAATLFGYYIVAGGYQLQTGQPFPLSPWGYFSNPMLGQSLSPNNPQPNQPCP